VTIDAYHPDPEIEKKLEAIYNLHTKKMDFRLDKGPYRDLLKKLGNPHNNLPPIVHIAGTNGKGSTLAFLKTICEVAELDVHTYTSPHLVKFNERISLKNEQITDKALFHYLNLIDIINDKAPLTFFEFTTALAFKAMADHPGDICLLETGLGGRLDCTNVVEKPLATVITAIGHDHMDWLGNNIQKIAAEKAGIMKPGVPCIIAPQQYDAVFPVFEAKAKEVGCPLHFATKLDDTYELGLVGDHQRDNAGTVLKTVQTILPGIPNDYIIKGLAQTKWPARMEKISDNPEIWFDCGHNAEGAAVIANQLKTWKQQSPDRPVHIILGLASDKNADDFMAPLWTYCDKLTCVDLKNARNAQTAEELKSRFTKKPVSIQTVPTIKDALTLQQRDNVLTLITGSLYLYEQIKF
jgi:dihydrofolate synthase/folylpolyglutamate synthase